MWITRQRPSTKRHNHTLCTLEPPLHGSVGDEVPANCVSSSMGPLDGERPLLAFLSFVCDFFFLSFLWFLSFITFLSLFFCSRCESMGTQDHNSPE